MTRQITYNVLQLPCIKLKLDDVDETKVIIFPPIQKDEKVTCFHSCL